jgi:hypothetical protein
MLIGVFPYPAKFFSEPVERLHTVVRVTRAPEDDLALFAVIADDVDNDPAVVAVVPIEVAHWAALRLVDKIVLMKKALSVAPVFSLLASSELHHPDR